MSATRRGRLAPSSESFAGKAHVLYFWFSGCPPCTRTSPLLPELQRRHAARGFEVVALNADAVLEVPAERGRAHGLRREARLDVRGAEATPEAIEAYGSVSVFPTFFFVDREA